MEWVLITTLWLALATQAVSQSPIVLPWNTKKSFGPDGPWQAVEMLVGTNQLPVSLYPGGWFETDIISTSICNSGDPNCPASAAGLYDPSTESPVVAPGQIARTGFIDQWNFGPASNETGTGQFMADALAFNGPDNAIVSVPQVAFSLIEQASIQLPNGTVYSPEVGFLPLGQTLNQGSYPLTNGSNVTANYFTGYLFNTSQIPSVSAGLHIGSVPNGQGGSMVIGGYDQSRAVGTVGVYDLSGIGGGEPVVEMIDVSLGVEQGNSPFNTTKVGSLFNLATSHNNSVPTSLNSCVPYMAMPLGICESVAEYLPVTFNSDLGLYTWNTDDPRYSEIVKSAAYMSITFPTTGEDSFSIKVPFTVLDLTLSQPLVSQSTQYFPCKPTNPSDGHYFLGRAFFQAAYLGINWHTNKFFLAQAAGPDSGDSRIVAFSTDDTTMGSVSNTTFASSWQSKWSPVNGIPSSSLSKAAIAGIVVGSIITISLIVAGAFCLIKRRRTQNRARASLKGSIRSPFSTPLPTYSTGPQMPDKPQYVASHEMYGDQPQLVELDNGGRGYTPLSYAQQAPMEADSREIGEIPVGRDMYDR